MGMTIEENIATLKEHLNTLNADKGVEFYQEIESIQSAIETMRKYEEIEKIVEDRNGEPPLTTLNEIIMVVEEWTYYKKKVRENKEFIDKLTKNIPTWKLVLIDKLTDFKVWFWLKTHKGADNGNDD